MGLFTETMYRLDATDNADLAHLDGTREKVASVLQVLKDRLSSFTPNHLKVTLDGRDLSGEYSMLEVMNISYIGPNLCWPSARQSQRRSPRYRLGFRRGTR